MQQNNDFDLGTLFSVSSLSRHVFLTGQSGIGKTYCLQLIIKSLSDKVCVGGFTTSFDIESTTEKTLYISSVGEKKACEKKAVMHWFSGTVSVFEEVFEHYGVELLQKAQNSNFLIMDELGRFEENCEQFKREIFKCLDGTIPILGVIRSLDYVTWLDDVKNHPNVTVLHVGKHDLDRITHKLQN